MPANDRWVVDDVLDGFRKQQYPTVAVAIGMTLTHTGSGTIGQVAGFAEGDTVVLLDEGGQRQHFRAHDGAFLHNGVRVALRKPATPVPRERQFTASGSIAAESTRAKVAIASRIWVEGIHDAELVEKVWGDDLRDIGIVVEPLHGADDLASAVAAFAPGNGRRLGILLDHLVVGSKESRIAQATRHPSVLVCGHPYVDIWAAIRPETIGIDAWPEVPRGLPWKEGVIAAIGMSTEPGRFWREVLDATSSYRDLETPLVNAVEQLIDFVAPE